MILPMGVYHIAKERDTAGGVHIPPSAPLLPYEPRYNINMRQHLSIFILIMGALLSPVRTAWACEPQPDYWFAERYEFGPK